MVALTALTLGTVLFLSQDSTTASASPLEHPAFHAYKARYGKNYASQSDASYRRAVYAANMAYIRRENAKGRSHTLGETPFTDLTFEEFSAKYLMQTPLPNPKTNAILADTGALKCGNKDWRKEGVVSPVKNQGQCGSCWAFSAVGSLESAVAIKTGKITEFSEQELVDCSDDYGNAGCNGGLPSLAFDYVQDHQISLESDYVYTARDGSCKASKYKTKQAITGYKTLKNPSVETLIAAIAEQPVSVGIEVQSDFMHYKSGIYKPADEDCGDSLNHGVVAVGYLVDNNDEKSYFIIKNSWSNTWGEEGYIRVAVGSGRGTCGIANKYDAYPQV